MMMISGDGSSSDWRPTWPNLPSQPSLSPLFPSAASAGSHVLLLVMGSLQLLSSIQQEDT